MFHSLRIKPLAILALLGAGVLLSGCDDGPDSIKLDSGFTLGGYVFYNNGADAPAPTFVVADTPIPDFTVKVIEADGDEKSGLSDATGYYEVKGLKSGARQIEVSGTGYQTFLGPDFAVCGQELISVDDFIRCDIQPEETQFSGTLSVGGVVLQDGDVLTHGLENVSAQYTASTDTTIVITLNQAAGDANFGVASASMDDGTNPLIFTSLDATRTILTFSEVDINTLATQAATDTFGGVTLSVFAQRLTPIHGYVQSFSADIDILLVP